MQKIKGMRDIPTLQGQGRNGRTVPGTRQQVASELASLEVARARLERERDIWVRNQQRVDRQLESTAERLHLLRQTLNAMAEETLSEQPTRHRVPGRRSLPPRPRSPARPDTADEPGEQDWNHLTFEY